MLLVDGQPLSSSSSSSSSSLESGGRELVAELMASPALRASSDRLKAAPERRISLPSPALVEAARPRHVYVFQREYATVDPARVQLVGTDEATTCVGLVIRNRNTGMTSISHLDFPKIVDRGLLQMLELLGDDNAPFDVHMIGGFDDASTKLVLHSVGRKRSKQEGYSFPLCCKIVGALQKCRQQFHLQSFCVLGNNTETDAYGNTRPTIDGFVVDTLTGLVTPASFDMTSRCPDEIVRRIRVSVSSYDPSWQGRLLETYDTRNDVFRIAAVCWMPDWAEIASSYSQLSDSQVLLQCSTSPAAEPPHFVDNERRIWKYMIKNPDWEETFPKGKPRVFHRASDGTWFRYS